MKGAGESPGWEARTWKLVRESGLLRLGEAGR